MTQLEYYTHILKILALLGLWGLGVAGLIALGVTSYYLFPWLKK